MYRHIKRIKVTKDPMEVNRLFEEDWALLSVLETNDHEFLFLMGWCDWSKEEKQKRVLGPIEPA